jgi:integrase
MDTKHLLKINKSWYINYRLPKEFGGEVVKISLKTGDIKKARYYRDTVLLPLISLEVKYTILQRLSEEMIKTRQTHNELLETMKTNIRVINSKNSISECLKQYGFHLNNRTTLKPKSIKRYAGALNTFFNLIIDKEINLIVYNDILAARNNLQDSKNYKPNGIIYIFQIAKQFIEWCEKEKLCRKDLLHEFVIDLPKTKQEHTVVIPENMADQAVNAIQKWSLPAIISRYTGMRRDEVMKMSFEDIITDNGIDCIFIPAAKTKTETERTVPIASKLKPYITKENIKVLKNYNVKRIDKYNREEV